MTDRALPALPARDFAKTGRFFAALGFDMLGGSSEWLRLRRDQVEIRFWQSDIDWTGPEMALVDRLCIFAVADVVGWHARLAAARVRWKMMGAPSLTSVTEGAWGVPAFCFTDPDRNVFWVVEDAAA